MPAPMPRSHTHPCPLSHPGGPGIAPGTGGLRVEFCAMACVCSAQSLWSAAQRHCTTFARDGPLPATPQSHFVLGLRTPWATWLAEPLTWLDSAHANLGAFLFCTAHIAPHVPSQSAQRTSDGYGHVLGVCLPLVGKRCVMQLFHTHHVVMIT